MKAESIVQTQVRLVLEQQCAALFGLLWPAFAHLCDLTLLVYDFGDSGNVAFKTSLRTRPELVRICEATLERWRTGMPGPVEPGAALPDEEILRVAAEIAKREMPAGVGFSLLLGRGTTSVYISNGERSTVAELIRNDLLPQWRGA